MDRTVLHVITSLNPGGAEEVLTRLVIRAQGGRHRHVVVNLAEGDTPLTRRIEAAGVRVISLDATPGSADPRVILKLAKVMRRERPAVVQTWMYHADLLGGLAAKLAGSPPVAWNIRNGTLGPAFSKRMTLAIARANARLSGVLPAAIVCCAESAKQIHVEIGYDARRMLVIPNGYELDRFRPDPEARARIRAEAGIPDDALVAGLVARLHPQKDHQTFFEAAGHVARRFPNAHFLLCGEQVTPDNPEIGAMVGRAGIKERCHLLGYRADMPAIQASLDIACLCSQGGEGFPNAIAEAMACGVPCAVSDVGDAAAIVDDTGRVAPAGDASALAKAISGLLSLDHADRARFGHRARQRIIDHYDIGQFMARYEALYDQLAEAGRSGDWAFGLSD